MNLRSLLAAATCLALPLAAYAAPVSGPYIDAGFGTSIQQDTSLHSSGPLTLVHANNATVTGSVSGKISYGPAFAGVGDVGYGFGDGFRVQVGGNYFYNKAKNGGGSADTYGVMVNGLYDFPVSFPVVPYLGAGAGYQWQKLDLHDDGDGSVNGSSGSLAYDVIAGVSYDIPGAPGLAVTGEYRFMQLVQTRHYQFNDGIVSARLNAGNTINNTILVGLRYAFSAPRPAPSYPLSLSPAPVADVGPPPARTFLVFFDWDKADVSARAAQIIAQAAAGSKTASTTTLDVSGYTDTSGTADYNQGLSERRAKSVAAALVQDGIPESEIEIHAYGETHLLVATGPGVREPQNRRVEIVLQ